MIDGFWGQFFDIGSIFLFWYFLVVNSFYALLILLSIPGIYIRFKETSLEDVTDLLSSESLPSIAVIMPAFNESATILPSIEGVLDVSYPTKEVVVVNDGSTDDTLEKIKEAFDLVETVSFYPQVLKTAPIRRLYRSKKYPELLVVDKENGGSKSDANNAGINMTMARYFVVIDADTILEKDTLLRMVRPFFEHPQTVGQGGTLRILNGCSYEKGHIIKYDLPKQFLPAVQVTEYLRAFLYGRLGWNHLGGALIISGAFGQFDRKTVLEMGGYDAESSGEDFELTLHLNMHQRKKGLKDAILFVPDPVAWTLVPDTYQKLSKQRARWHQGLIETLAAYKPMFLNPKYGLTGMVGYTYMVFGEMLEPLCEGLGYIFIVGGFLTGYVSSHVALLLFAIAIGLTAVLSMISTIMEVTTFRRYRYFSQFFKLFFYAIFENFGVRQCSVWWRIRGFWQYFREEKRW